MMKTFYVLAATGLIAVVTAGCASQGKTTQSMLDQQEKRINGMLEQVDSNAAMIRENKNEIAALSQRLADFESKLSTSVAEEQAINQEIKENLSFMNDQILRLDNSIRTKRPSAPPSAANVFKPGGFEVDSSYKGALDEYYARRYESAISGFTEVLTVSPTSALADNAQYWIGECYYGMKKYQQALDAFLKVFDYPKSNKLPDAHYKIGITHRLMGNMDAAKEELKAVVQNYPGTAASKLASQELTKLGE